MEGTQEVEAPFELLVEQWRVAELDARASKHALDQAEASVIATNPAFKNEAERKALITMKTVRERDTSERSRVEADAKYHLMIKRRGAA